MKITKYVHSCLLVETEKETVLFDPGQFSWESGTFNIDTLKKLDIVVITHEHPDHFYDVFVKVIEEKFPKACFISTPTVVAELKKLGVKNAVCESMPSIKVFSTKRHAKIEPLAPSSENIAVHVADRLTVGGDRHDLEETKEILALPITAPWGSAREAADMALRLKPKFIIPIHDWHWNEAARLAEYGRSGEVYAHHGITLIKPVDGVPIEL